MNALIVIAAVVILGVAAMIVEMLRTPAGIEREHRTEKRKIFSSTKTLVDATPDEVIRLLQSDWSWWKRARAEKMTELGDGRKEFIFHPVRILNLIETPPAFSVRFDSTETLPDAGKRIHATLKGDFDGHAEYTARPGPAGTIVELAWSGVEGRNLFSFPPATLTAWIHCWRERLGAQGLRDRLNSGRSGTQPNSRLAQR